MSELLFFKFRNYCSDLSNFSEIKIYWQSFQLYLKSKIMKKETSFLVFSAHCYTVPLKHLVFQTVQLVFS